MGKFYNLTPKEIVAELDKYIIGQESAKKSVAIALRNRHRRNQLSDEMREEVTPKNILMVGPTGCGKTEIARRLAKIMEAPFVKVEATKFTEVGYVGRDVDSIIRDLVEASVRLTKQQKMEEKYKMADEIVEEKIVEAMMPKKKAPKAAPQNNANPFGGNQSDNPFAFLANIPGMSNYIQPVNTNQNQPSPAEQPAEESGDQLAKEQIRQQLKNGLLEDQMIDIDVLDTRSNMIDLGGNENMSISIGSIFGDALPKKTKKRRVKVSEARKILRDQEAQNLLDMDQVTSEAVENAEQNGIVFIDEIDKIADDSSYGRGPGVSREGVQRDILPIVEGSVVNTKYGPVKTDHMLFIGAGAFHVSKPTDLIPELQGRFPIRVELESLTKEDLKNILTVPKNALITQHKLLLETEGVHIEFTDDAVDEIAEIAYISNETNENMGARRLHTVMEKLTEDISFELPDPELTEVIIDGAYVKEKFADKVNSDDLDRYIL
ncbi:MAG: ATP-dependent protease ATPase subunit HslU [Anaerovoracaceae bacterium]|nr:ATP-dependent protease ATPase subunit HslU [Bacillota bacterium]MDD7733503.1 ATP-dependent protease ATPase subunit HslU [Bacillota bacterium]MDY5906472.1 ATP-dependent protease ATPase subunit HslU [Anaerovoracaceae bacterium]